MATVVLPSCYNKNPSCLLQAEKHAKSDLQTRLKVERDGDAILSELLYSHISTFFETPVLREGGMRAERAKDPDKHKPGLFDQKHAGRSSEDGISFRSTDPVATSLKR